MQRRTLELTETERKALEWQRSRDPRAYIREIASALLQIADGKSACWVAQHGLLRKRDPDTVYRWLDGYEEHRTIKAHQPRRRRFSPLGQGM